MAAELAGKYNVESTLMTTIAPALLWRFVYPRVRACSQAASRHTKSSEPIAQARRILIAVKEAAKASTGPI